MDDDEVEHFAHDETLAPSNYGLRAAWGPTRWHTGSYVTDAVYAPDGESILFIGDSTVMVRLDRAGCRVGAPHAFDARSVRLSGDGSRVAVVQASGAVVVLEVASMREVFRVQGSAAPAQLYGATLSGDGTVVAIGSQVWRIGVADPIDEIEGLFSLSDDGALALAVRAYPPGHPTTSWLVSLHRVGARGAPLRTQHSYQQVFFTSAWSADGQTVAWTTRGAVNLWSTRDPAVGAVAPRDPHRREGRQDAGHFVTVDGALQLLVGGAAGLTALTVDGRPVRSFPSFGAVVAVTRDGLRALVVLGGAYRELDLESGQPLGSAVAGVWPRVAQVAWHPSEPVALVFRLDGELRLWDVAAWRTERLVDRETSRLVLADHPRVENLEPGFEMLDRERVRMMFTQDGRGIVVVGVTAAVSMLRRDGSVAWQSRFEPVQGGRWTWFGGTPGVGDDGDIWVDALWVDNVRDQEGNIIGEEQTERLTFDAERGELRSRTVIARARAAMPGPAPPRFEVWRCGRVSQLRALGQLVPVPLLTGELWGVFPSPDERVLLVTTASGRLLRFDRSA